MAVFASVFALAGRFASRLLNAVLGWATMLLFGKVEGRKQIILLLIALASILWVAVLLGVIVPDVGVFLVALVPVPSFVDDAWVRIAMLVAAAAIPLVVGVAGVVVLDAGRRPSGLGLGKAVLRGYPFTLVLAVTIAILGVFAFVWKIRSLTRRWTGAHVPLIVKPGSYDEVLAELADVLRQAGFDIDVREAPRVLSVPPRLLDLVAGRSLGALVPDQLMVLATPDLEVLVYPSDLSISGTTGAVARARSAIAVRLVAVPAYLTPTREAEAIEDVMERLAGELRTDPVDVALADRRFAEIDDRLATLEVPFDEWETVYRQRLQLERDVLRRRVQGRATVGLDDDAPNVGRVGLLERVVGVAGIGLIAVDIAFALADRFAPRRGR